MYFYWESDYLKKAEKRYRKAYNRKIPLVCMGGSCKLYDYRLTHSLLVNYLPARVHKQWLRHLFLLHSPLSSTSVSLPANFLTYGRLLRSHLFLKKDSFSTVPTSALSLFSQFSLKYLSAMFILISIIFLFVTLFSLTCNLDSDVSLL